MNYLFPPEEGEHLQRIERLTAEKEAAEDARMELAETLQWVLREWLHTKRENGASNEYYVLEQAHAQRTAMKALCGLGLARLAGRQGEFEIYELIYREEDEPGDD